jgi:hypothetical protein
MNRMMGGNMTMGSPMMGVKVINKITENTSFLMLCYVSITAGKHSGNYTN